MDVGKRVREMLVKEKMSQNELARRLGKYPSYVTKILDRSSIETKTLEKVCEILGYDILIVKKERK